MYVGLCASLPLEALSLLMSLFPLTSGSVWELMGAEYDNDPCSCPGEAHDSVSRCQGSFAFLQGKSGSRGLSSRHGVAE